MAIIVGHRGVAGHAPENTLAGIRKALELGLTHVEIDVRLTKDRVPVVFHDAAVTKLTHGNELVRELTVAEIQALPVPPRRKVPTLAEALAVIGDMGLLVDLKSSEALKPALEVLRQDSPAQNVLLASFNPEPLRQAKKEMPGIYTCLLFRHPMGFLFRRFERRLWRAIEQCGCDYIGPRSNVVRRELVDRAHALGHKVYAYHVNSRRRGLKLMGMGVDALGTDHPELFGIGSWVERVTP